MQRDYIRLLLFTGLRRREAAALTWDDVDFSAGVIRVPSFSTKNSKPLNLPMSDVVRDIFIARRNIGKTSPTRGKSFVFPANSKSGHMEEPKFALAEVAAACGVQVSVHDLRRTFASVAAKHAMMLELKALMNHATGNDVTANYVTLDPKQLSEAARRIVDGLKELCGIEGPKGKNIARLRRTP